MTLLKCNYLIFTNLFFCYFYSYCYNFKISGKKLHLFTRAARARSSKQNTRANVSVFCLHIWPSIKSRAINGLNKCVFGFYSHSKVWYKSKKAFGMCSEWHYTTRGLAYGDMSPSANLPRCVMPFWTHAHAFSLYSHALSHRCMHAASVSIAPPSIYNRRLIITFTSAT